MAIFLAFIISLGIVILVGRIDPKLEFGLSTKSLLGILLPGCLIFLLGVYDDIYPLTLT